MAAKDQDVVGVQMTSPESAQMLGIDDTFTMTCLADLSGAGKIPSVTYTQQYCDISDCSGTVSALTIDIENEVVTLDAGSDNPYSTSATSPLSNTAVAGYPGQVFVRCKVQGGGTCSAGCYSNAEKVNVTVDCMNDEVQQCGITDVGACEYGNQTCVDWEWGGCVGNIDPVDEICNNSIDDDCDGTVDEDFDNDQDGFGACTLDCDDDDPDINPNATEACNNLDDDCDYLVDEDFDQDGDNYTTCSTQQDEVIVGDGSQPVAFIYEHNGSSLQNTYNITGLASSPVAIEVGDLDDDGSQEIVIGSSEIGTGYKVLQIHRYDGDGWVSWYNSTFADDSSQGFYALDVGDVNNDSVDDIVAAGYYVFSSYANAFVIFHNESDPDGFTEVELIPLGNFNSFALTIGDFNSNGINEILISNHYSGYQKILVFEWDGAGFVNIKNITIGANVIDDMDSGDVNSEPSSLEFIACGGFSELWVYAWNGTDYEKRWLDSFSTFTQTCDIVDLDNDDVNDLLVTSSEPATNEDGLYFYSYNASLGPWEYSWRWQKTDGTSISDMRTGDSGDIDGDGLNEYVVDFNQDFYVFQNDTGGPGFDAFQVELFSPHGTCVADIISAGPPGDCDDTNSSIHPGATEICGDGIDQDCDGEDLPC